VSDPHLGPVAEVFTFLGIGGAWCVALACAALGALCGLIGVVIPSRRTTAAWAALALNGAVVAISVVLLMALSP
jgi:hypothetical protein